MMYSIKASSVPFDFSVKFARYIKALKGNVEIVQF